MNINADAMLETAEKACELLKAVAHPHRLAILCQLVEGEKSVGDLAGYLCIRQTAVSQNLALMRGLNLVSARRDGQTMWYSISSEEARQLLDTLYRIYCSEKPLCDRQSKKPSKKPSKKSPAEKTTSTKRKGKQP